MILNKSCLTLFFPSEKRLRRGELYFCILLLYFLYFPQSYFLYFPQSKKRLHRSELLRRLVPIGWLCLPGPLLAGFKSTQTKKTTNKIEQHALSANPGFF